MRRLLFLLITFGILLAPYALLRQLGVVGGTIGAAIWSVGFIAWVADRLQKVILGTESLAGAEDLPVYILYLLALLVITMMSHFLGFAGSVLIIALVTTWFVEKTR